MKKSMFIIALAVAATACNNTQNQENKEEAAVEQTAENTATTATANLFAKEWKLVTLNGKAIVLSSSFNKEPHLIFDKENNRVTGNGGCNGFGGNLELTGTDGISISDIAATQMACPDLEVEQGFIEALRAARHYHIDGNTLTLHDGNHVGLAMLQFAE